MKSELIALPEIMIQQILTTIGAEMKKGLAPIAVFDADGTLWDSDVGENFFQYLIDHQLVQLPNDPWHYYETLKAEHPPRAYLWLSEILNGIALSQVRAWARAATETFPPVLLPGVKELISQLRAQKIECYVVSASVTWSVEAAAKLAGLEAQNALGVETQVIEGKVTLTPVYPVTWREGKAEKILQVTSGQRPVFACGNTSGDIAMLDLAHHRLAVRTQNQANKLYSQEAELAQEAQTRGWWQHSYRQQLSSRPG